MKVFADSKFLINARGSVTETIDHLIIALDEDDITDEIFNKLRQDCDECSKMINGYIGYLRDQLSASKANYLLS